MARGAASGGNVPAEDGNTPAAAGSTGFFAGVSLTVNAAARFSAWSLVAGTFRSSQFGSGFSDDSLITVEGAARITSACASGCTTETATGATAGFGCSLGSFEVSAGAVRDTIGAAAIGEETWARSTLVSMYRLSDTTGSNRGRSTGRNAAGIGRMAASAWWI